MGTVLRLFIQGLLILYIGTGLLTPLAGAAATLHDTEYAIVAAAISHGINADTGKLIIDGETTGEVVSISDGTRSAEEIAEEIGSTVVAMREWSRVNRKRAGLQAQLAALSDYEILPPGRRLEIFSQTEAEANWEQFRAAFPGSTGIIRVSRPGIDHTIGVALLYLEFECGALCGSGRLINLQQNPSGKWQVTSGAQVWVAAPD